MALRQQKGLPLDLRPPTPTLDPSPSLSLSLQAGVMVSRPSTGAACRSGLSDVESSFCSPEGESAEETEDGRDDDELERLLFCSVQREDERTKLRGGGRRGGRGGGLKMKCETEAMAEVHH